MLSSDQFVYVSAHQTDNDTDKIRDLDASERV